MTIQLGASARRRTIAIPAAGIELTGDAYGSPDDVPVVLLHGGGQTRHSWASTAADLARAGWYAVSMDLRGHGDSGWAPDARYGLDDFSGDVEAVVEFLGRVPVLIGASLGGVASLAALGRNPGIALGLILVDVSPFVQPDGASRIRDFMTAKPDGYTSLDEVADAVAAYLPHRPRPQNVEGLRKNLRKVGDRWFWHWDPDFLLTAFDQPIHRNALIDPVRLGAASSSLRVPTLLVRGGESDVLSHADVRQFLALVPHAEFATIPEAHHMVAGDDNSVFETVLGDFLERRISARLSAMEGQ